jgi:hypothetical protein
MNNLYKTALEYRGYGWSIIPVRVSSKLPAIPWKKYQTEYATDEELKEWFENKNQEDVGIGLVTGRLSNVVVVDLDSYKENAPQIELNTPVKVKTGGGGTHGYFKYREGIRNTVEFKKATDIRGEGGYVVLPPSKHPSRKYYEWIEKDIENIPELDSSFVESWQEVKEPLDLTQMSNKKQGDRNDSLYRTACSLISKHSEEEAWTLVNDINRTYDPPLTDQEVKTLFSSAYKFIKTEHEGETPAERSEALLLGEPVAWSKIKEDQIHREWLWENFLAKGNITLFSSLAKAGKTTLLRCLFVAMKNEEEFVGQPTKKCRVLVLSEESSAEWADGRDGISDGDIEHVLIWPRPTRGIPSAKDWVEIIDLVSKKSKELNIDLVVIDTISTFWPVDDENDAAKVKRALVPLYKLTDDNGVALMIVHHFKKDGGKEGTASRGSGALTGHVDNIIEFRRNEDGYPNQRKIKTMGRFTQETELIIELNNAGKYETKGEPWVVSKKSRMDKILSLMNEMARPVTVPEITSLWNSRLNKISERTIRRYIEELKRFGQVVCDRIEIVTTRPVEFYACTGWKEAAQGEILTEKSLGKVPVTISPSVTIPVNISSQNSLKDCDRTATVATGEESVTISTLSDKEIPFEEDEEMPF